MKYLIAVLGLVMSICMLSGCASKCDCPTGNCGATPAPAHHDLKGEVK
jgi:hypothetical protein